MRNFIDNIKKLFEGDVVDLKQHKTQKIVGDYANSIAGIYAAEADFFSSGKFSPFAQSYIESGFKEEFRPQIGMMVYFRDYRVSPEARQLLNMMAKARPKWDIRRTKFHKEWTGGAKWGPVCHLEDMPFEAARKVWEERENSQFGAYCPSRSGYRTSHLENWNDHGVGFSMTVGGQDGRRGDKYGNDTREEYHIIDDEKDMAEVSHMFALIRRAKMVAK